MNAVLRKLHEEARERKLRMFPQCRPAAVVIPMMIPPAVNDTADELPDNEALPPPLPIQRNAHVLAFYEIRARIPVNIVISAASQVTGASTSMFAFRSGNTIESRARQIVMYVLLRYTRRSSKDIAARVDRDHSTVLHAANRIRFRISRDKHLASDVQKVLDQLGIPLSLRLEAAP